MSDTAVKENRILSVRLNLAGAWITLLQHAYDALLHHGINYRSLPEWKDKEGLLDSALDKRGTLEAGQAKIMLYIERLTNAITAAIRRKSMRPVH